MDADGCLRMRQSEKRESGDCLARFVVWLHVGWLVEGGSVGMQVLLKETVHLPNM